MDTGTLVENQIDDGRRLLSQLQQEGIPVVVACWIKPAAEERWSLHIATPLVEQKGWADAYGEVYRALRSLGPLAVTDSEIKLIRDTHPVAKALLKVADRFPRMPTRSRGPLPGGIPVEEFVLYPVHREPMTPLEVAKTVVGLLLNRAATRSDKASLVTLRDGSTIQAIPTGIHMVPADRMRISLLDVGTNTEREVTGDKIVNIQ